MPTFDLGLVKGPKGDPGDRGEQGIQGVPGPQGNPGYTPVRGTDYFTEADKQDLADAAAEKVINESVVGQILGIDTTPTSGSGNLVTSGGVYTSLQNNDPRNWGLGNNLPVVDANYIDGTMFFQSNTNMPTAQMWIGYQIERIDGDVIRKEQFAFRTGSNLPEIAVRKYTGENGWTPWEYLNPPMNPDKEYRTTERHLGKPVYKKRFTINALPNNAQLIQENVINASTDSLFDLHITFVDTSSGAVSSYPPFYGNTVAARAWVRGTGELVITTFADLSSSKAIVTLKYTKTIN